MRVKRREERRGGKSEEEIERSRLGGKIRREIKVVLERNRDILHSKMTEQSKSQLPSPLPRTRR